MVGNQRRCLAGLVAITVLCLGCSTPATTGSRTGNTAGARAAYLDELTALCASASALLKALPAPPTDITTTEFATRASEILRNESENMRALKAPDALVEDHRALIRNEDAQAAAWGAIAQAARTNGDFGDVATRVAELNLGRNDLVAEMGAPACARLANP
jgi:hypothetical protein